MSDADGLICAYVLDGNGGGREVGWDEIRGWKASDGTLWVHFDRKGEDSIRWIREESGLDPVTCDALLAEETRPRNLVVGEGMLVILRGVNLNPGADPEDMVSIRTWLEPRRIFTLRHLRVMAVQDLRDAMPGGRGPRDSGEFLVQLSQSLIERMGPVIDDLDDTIDEMEQEILELPSRELRTKLAGLRRQAIVLRRHLAPQRDVMTRVSMEHLPWLGDTHRQRLREVSDRLLRYIEDLDSARERAAVTQDELSGRISEQMNKTMYVLSLVAAIFLPLGLITGLLGINVGGIPGAENDWGFAVVCAALAALAGILIWTFRRMRWF